MKTFRKELGFILTYFWDVFGEKNFLLLVKRMTILSIIALIIVFVYKWFNFPTFLMLAIVMILLICFSYAVGSYLIYCLKEAKEAIREIIAMIKNL